MRPDGFQSIALVMMVMMKTMEYVSEEEEEEVDELVIELELISFFQTRREVGNRSRVRNKKHLQY